MSLKDHLGDKNSPVRQFLRTQFPSTRTFLADSRKHIRQSYTIRQDADVPWSKIGTALDYRIRYYFAVTPYQELVAYRGTLRLSDAQVHNPTGSPLATRANGDSITIFDRSTGRIVGMYFPEHNGGAALDQSVSICDVLAIGREAAERNAGIESDGDSPLTEALEDFFCRLHSLTKRRSPVGTRLSLAEEDELNRYCFALALMEEVVRTGRLDGVVATGEFSDAESLLSLAEPHWIDDLTELSWKFYDGFNHLLRLPHVLNPRFDGSRDVGGADADIVVDGVLIDIKATVRPEIRSDWIWQLLGYVLLDYSDRHRIDSIGLYLARQGELIKWDLDDAIRGLSSGEPPSIEELRTRFRELVQSPS